MRLFPHLILCICLLSLCTSLGCRRNKGNLNADGESIEVLVIYTPEAVTQAQQNGYSNVEAIAHERINYANGSFMQSGVPHQLNLAGTMEVQSQDEIAEIMEVTPLRQKHVRNWMSAELTDETTDLSGARHSTQADLIVILHTNLGNTSGQARLSSGTDELDYKRSHAAVNWNSEAAFTHEVGHLFGAAHDEYRLDSVNSNPVVSYGQGYVDTAAEFRTMMSYTTECNDAGVACPRVPIFSNPNIDQGGQPSGTESSAYNACVLSQRGPYLSQFYEYWSGQAQWETHRLAWNCNTELLPLD